ncbi:MAG: hydrogenase formation protein HypD [Desulfobulbaceae bacterium]|nr:hydrogenase formation protein HypD [Desulfobulbaceae bacterium]
MISDEFRSIELAEKLTRRIHETVNRPMRIMEVCGTHTMAIFRHGIRSLLPADIELISGPGCPVCVTSAGEIDQIIELAGVPGIIIATFGDLLRVPGSKGINLAAARAEGAQVEIVYSPTDALKIAQSTDKPVIFPAIGFETTIPVIAATVFEAKQRSINNFMLLVSHKVVPPALDVLLGDPELALDGLLCPGHVSTIIGSRAYEPFAEKYRIPCVIAGFEPLDILSSIYMLASQIRQGRAGVENCYGRVVSREGNLRAREMINMTFESCDATWRGLGNIPGSGLKLKQEFINHDAALYFGLSHEFVPEPRGCRCGEILTGRVKPPECPLFNTRCTPTAPVGPCMVSSEGTCAAYSRYGDL